MDQNGTQKAPSDSPKKREKPLILVAPLDWGLGHATRCIPLIRELIQQDCDVILAGEGAQTHLLSVEFPGMRILTLPGYRVRYAKSAFGLFANMLFQTPRILRTIRSENKWLKKIIDEYSIDAVISDNRYGLYSRNVHCIFITHQLRIRSPLRWFENNLQKRNYRYINNFNACWVPDLEGENNLAGELSHPLKKPAVPTHYIGPLSRFRVSENSEVTDRLIILLSGPEPQRTIFENKIIEELAHYPGTAVVVRGLPGSANLIPSTNMIRFFNHLSTNEMEKEIRDAAFVVARCGYSTVMDLVTLNKKAVVVPTPGQTEQEYLGKHLHANGIACCMNQSEFSLENALQNLKSFSFTQSGFLNNNRLPQLVSELIAELSVSKKLNPS